MAKDPKFSPNLAASRPVRSADRPSDGSDSDLRFAARLEQAKAQSVAQLLFKCARLLNEQALARFDVPEGAPRLRPAHTSLFPHIDLAGTRLTDLAKRVGVSKQAIGQLVDELEQLGVIERVADPQDGRAKLIRFPQKPGRSLLDGLSHLKKFEDELAEAVGRERMAALHDALTALLSVLERRAKT